MIFSPVFYRLYPAHLHYKFQNYYFWLFQALPKKEGPAATPYSAATGPSKVDSFTSYTAPEAYTDY